MKQAAIPEGKAEEILKGLTSYWADRSPSYSRQNVEEMNNWKRKAWCDLILQYAPDKDLLRILDVGTGPGFFAMALNLAGHDVTAVDVTEKMLVHARENADAYGAHVNFVLHRGEELPFADGSFDLIVSRNVMWNLEYPETALGEWKRVLTPGGRLVYFDANWYLYLFDEELQKPQKKLREEFIKLHPDFSRSGDLPAGRAQDLERIAYDLPLSREHRPEWDRGVLEGLDMRIVKIIGNVGPLVQEEWEQAREALTPMFMICAEKEVV